jgi:alpha-tubulin suppressor-like RCC1 family protein
MKAHLPDKKGGGWKVSTETGRFVYVAGNGRLNTNSVDADGNLTPIDVYFSGYLDDSTAVYGDGNIIYVHSSEGLITFSVDDRGYLTRLDTDTTLAGFTNINDIWSDGNFVYATDGSVLASYDVDEYGNITPLDTQALSGINLTVSGDGNTVFVGGNNGLFTYLVDGSGNFTNADSDDRGGNWIRDLWHDGDYLYVANGDIGIVVYGVDGSGNLTLVDSDDPGAGWAEGVWGDGEYVYVTQGESVYSYTVNGAGTLTLVDSDTRSGTALGEMWNDNSYLYVLNGLGGTYTVYTYSLSDGVDQWIAEDASGIQKTANYSWSSDGLKTFRVLARDDEQLRSDWTQHSINIKNGELDPPIITGTTTGFTGEDYEFGFTAEKYLSGVKHVGAGGYAYSCTLTDENEVYCWGYAQDGRLGDGQNSTNRTSPVRVLAGEAVAADSDGGYLANILQVSTGRGHACAIANSGNVYCWGDSQSGKLGDGQEAVDRLTPVRVLAGEAVAADVDEGYLTNIRYISVGAGSTCVISSTENLYCWGFGGFGELGDGQGSSNRSTPVRVLAGEAVAADASAGYLTNIKSISTGGYYSTCAVSNGGNAYCWGNQSSGALGNNVSSGEEDTPVRVHAGEAAIADSDGGYLSNIAQISSGYMYGCAISNGGNMYCWGNPSHGKLGDNQNSTNRLTPVRVHAGEAVAADSDAGYLTNIKYMSADGSYHTCAISNSGNTYCWGDSDIGQLGDGQNTVDKFVPTRVLDGMATSTDSDGTYLINMASISPNGYAATCATSLYGNVYCWGYQRHGRLGNGESVSESITSPVHVLVGETTSLVHYGIDWDMDGVAEVWLPPAGYSPGNETSSTTHAWGTAGDNTFQAFTQREGGATSTWSQHTITLQMSTNATPTASILFPDITEPDPSVLLQAGFSDPDEGSPMFDECSAIRWYLNDPTCSGTPIYEEDPANMIDTNNSVAHSHNLGGYGTFQLYLQIEDSYGGKSDCEARTVVVGTECFDDKDNNDDAVGNTGEEPWDIWFDDGLIGPGGSTTLADPSCFNYTNTDFINLLYNPSATPAQILAYFSSSTLYERNNPQCSDGIDNDDDGLIDALDAGCHTNYIAASSSTYSKFLNREQTCGVDTNGIICDPDETFGTCPIDCAVQFKFIEF